MQTQQRIILNTRTDIFIALFLVIVILAAYMQVKDFRFVLFDDIAYVTENTNVSRGITLDGIKWAFSLKEKKTMYWHPLTWISHMVDVQVYGLHPGNHHLINVLFHILSSVLLFVVFKKMTGDLWKSAFVAMVFACHPLNVESVAWISSRKTVLSVFFGMLTILFYVKYTERMRIKIYMLAIVFFLLALMAKPMLVTLPFVLLLLDCWPIKRFRMFKSYHLKIEDRKVSTIRVLLEKIPFLMISLLIFYVASMSMRQSHTFPSFESIPLFLRVENALVSYCVYLLKAFYPFDLAVFYPFPEFIETWKWVSAGLFLAGMSTISIYFVKKKPYLFVGWFWFLGTMIPMSGIVQAGLWPAMADRWAYFPLLGIFIIIAWLTAELYKKVGCKRQLLAIIVFIVSIVFTFQAWGQIRYWRDSASLFQHTIKITNNNSVAHNSMGTLYAMNDMIDKAEEHFEQAHRIDPNDITILYNLGRAYMVNGKIKDAINEYGKILKIDPKEVRAIQHLVDMYALKQDYANSILYVKKWIQLKPNNPYPYYYMSRIYARLNNVKEAIFWLDKSAKKGFNDWELIENDASYNEIRQTDYYKTLTE